MARFFSRSSARNEMENLIPDFTGLRIRTGRAGREEQEPLENIWSIEDIEQNKENARKEDEDSVVDEDIFFECEGPDHVESSFQQEQVRRTRRLASLSITMGEDNSLTPLFSAIASPRGVRKRIKWFFMQHSIENLKQTELLVDEIRSGRSSEEEIFERLHALYSSGGKNGSHPNNKGQKYSRFEEETKENTVHLSPDDEIEKNSNSDEEFSNDDELFISLTASDLRGEPLVRFSDTVLAIRTDMSGMPLGPETSPLKEEPIITTQPASPQRKSAWRGKTASKKTKKKRRMRRLSDAEKLSLYEWREDLKPKKFAERQQRLEAKREAEEGGPQAVQIVQQRMQQQQMQMQQYPRVPVFVDKSESDNTAMKSEKPQPYAETDQEAINEPSGSILTSSFSAQPPTVALREPVSPALAKGQAISKEKTSRPSLFRKPFSLQGAVSFSKPSFGRPSLPKVDLSPSVDIV